MRLIDIGANIMHTSFDKDREKIVSDAEKEGISPIIITGSDEKDSVSAQKYAENAPQNRFFSTAGVHPHNAKLCNEKTMAVLENLAGMPEVRAVGECGLDYNRNFSPKDAQIFWFERQIELACALNLPLFLHERDAFGDFSAILKKYSGKIPKMVVHCFTGTEEELAAYLDLGCYIGITGWICDERRGNHLHALVKKIPSDRLLLETDAPYLAPRTLSAKTSRNEPKNLAHIARFIAGILEKDPETLAEETFQNTLLFFSLFK
jgi:TatD DNase family protein